MTIEQARQLIRKHRAVSALGARSGFTGSARLWILGRQVSPNTQAEVERAALSLAEEIESGRYVKPARKIRSDRGMGRPGYAGRTMAEREVQLAKMQELRASGHTLKQIGDAQDPPITRERVRQLLGGMTRLQPAQGGSDVFIQLLREALDELEAERNAINGFIQVLEQIAKGRY